MLKARRIAKSEVSYQRTKNKEQKAKVRKPRISRGVSGLCSVFCLVPFALCSLDFAIVLRSRRLAESPGDFLLDVLTAHPACDDLAVRPDQHEGRYRPHAETGRDGAWYSCSEEGLRPGELSLLLEPSRLVDLLVHAQAQDREPIVLISGASRNLLEKQKDVPDGRFSGRLPHVVQVEIRLDGGAYRRLYRALIACLLGLLLKLDADKTDIARASRAIAPIATS
jgi:hypothetical protein